MFANAATDFGEKIEDRVVANTTSATADRVMRLAIAMFTMKQKLGNQVSESQEYAAAVLDYAEIHASIFLNICTEKEIEDLIRDVPELSSATDLYQKRGASALAKLSSIAPK